MTTQGRVYSVSSQPDAQAQADLDAIMAESVKRKVENERLWSENERLRAALNGILAAIDNRGRGLLEAVNEARKVRRGE